MVSVSQDLTHLSQILDFEHLVSPFNTSANV